MTGIELPRRLPAGGGSKGAVAAPTVRDVPSIRVARDPGLQANPAAFGADVGRGLEAAAGAIAGFGGSLAEVGLRTAAVKRRSAVASATSQAAADLQNWTLDLKRDPDYKTYGQRFEDRAKQAFEQYSAGLDQEGLAEFQDRFSELSLQQAYRVRLLSSERVADATIANLDTSLEGFAHVAGRAGTGEEFDLALRNGIDAIDRAVADGVITAESGARRRQEFSGRVEEVAAEQAVVDDPANAVTMLEDASIFPNLDEGRRVALRAAAKADIKREEARREVMAGRAVADAVFVLNRGLVPDNLASVQQAAQGTLFEADLNAAIRNRQAVADFMGLPLSEQGRQLRGIDQRATTTRSQVEQNEAKTRAYQYLATLVGQGNGLAAASAAGVTTEPFPLDFSNPASLQERAAQAQVASRWAGRPVSPLLDNEADALTQAIDTAAPGQVVGLLQSLDSGLGEEPAGTLAGQIAPKRPELAAALSLVQHDPLTARDIVVGGRAARDNPDLLPGREDRLSAIEGVYGDLFTAESAGALAAYTAAANALYAGRLVGSGSLAFDSTAYEQALRDVAGGPVQINGRTILPPVPGMSESAVEDLVAGLTNDDLAAYGNGAPVFSDGSAFTVDLFDRGMFSTDAQLVTAGPGRYLVYLPGLGYVQSASGGAYELNLRGKVR